MNEIVLIDKRKEKVTTSILSIIITYYSILYTDSGYLEPHINVKLVIHGVVTKNAVEIYSDDCAGMYSAEFIFEPPET